MTTDSSVKTNFQPPKTAVLRYQNIVVGEVSSIDTDLYRENACLNLLPPAERDTSDLAKQLFEWIALSGQLNELEYELDEEAYFKSLVAVALCEKLEQLPDFQFESGWTLLWEETGRIDAISNLCFSTSGVGWYLDTGDFKPAKPERKFRDALIGVGLGLLVLVIYYSCT